MATRLGRLIWIGEVLAIGTAWFMGITMIALGAAHLVFLNPDLRPNGGPNTGYTPLIGDVPILLMLFGWGIPTASLIVGGLVYHNRRRIKGPIAVAIGVTSYAVHLFYFGPLPLLAILVVATMAVHSRRFAMIPR